MRDVSALSRPTVQLKTYRSDCATIVPEYEPSALSLNFLTAAKVRRHPDWTRREHRIYTNPWHYQYHLYLFKFRLSASGSARFSSGLADAVPKLVDEQWADFAIRHCRLPSVYIDSSVSNFNLRLHHSQLTPLSETVTGAEGAGSVVAAETRSAETIPTAEKDTRESITLMCDDTTYEVLGGDDEG